MGEIIPVQTFTSSLHKSMFDKAKEFLIKHVGLEALKNFELPSHPTKEDIHVVPVSGGKDSTALAITLSILFPNVNFIYVFTDTKAEPEDVYKNLNALEVLLGKPIVRLSHPLGLFGYIDKYNGFLPSGQQRFCTVELKIKVIDQWFRESFDYDKQKVHTYVGFTYGEDRIGMITEEEKVSSHYPFLDLKIGVNEVFELLDLTIGISDIYSTKSRSGCYCCFYLRKYEKAMMLFERYNEFQKSLQYEKLTDDDLARFGLHDNPVLREALYSNDAIKLSGRQEYFIPASVDARTEFKGHSLRPKTLKLSDNLGKNKHEDQLSIFDMVDDFKDDIQSGYLYVAVGMWISSASRDYFGDMSYSGLYNTEHIAFSKSLTGLKKSLHFWVEHKLNVAPLYRMTSEEMRKDLKVALYQIKVDKSILEVLEAPSKGSYTWSSTESYMQIETLTRLSHSVLTFEGWKQFWDQNYSHHSNSSMDKLWLDNSYAYSIKKQINTYRPMYDALNAKITWSGIFPIPSQDEIDDVSMSAIMEKKDKEFKMSGAQSCAICSI